MQFLRSELTITEKSNRVKCKGPQQLLYILLHVISFARDQLFSLHTCFRRNPGKSTNETLIVLAHGRPTRPRATTPPQQQWRGWSGLAPGLSNTISLNRLRWDELNASHALSFAYSQKQSSKAASMRVLACSSCRHA